MHYKSVHVPVQKLDDFLAEFCEEREDDDKRPGKYAGWEIALMFVELHASPVAKDPVAMYRVILKSAE
jgi:hypothetical protein